MFKTIFKKNRKEKEQIRDFVANCDQESNVQNTKLRLIRRLIRKYCNNKIIFNKKIQIT